MNPLTRQYIFGGIFLALGIYQIVKTDYVETVLYLAAGTGFILNALSLEPKLAGVKKTLAIVTWVFIILTVMLFLYVIRYKF